MKITGTDSVSLEILKNLSAGTKVKDIPFLYSVSLDQAKRLSRYHSILEKSEEHLPASAIEKIRLIGLKVLYLSPLFKSEDWEGLTEVLSAINENTKRDELPLLMEALQKKRERIAEFKRQVDMNLKHLQRREDELVQIEDETNRLMKKAEEETQFLSKYSKKVQKFLIKHLGIYEDKLVLARRLDSLWQKALKKKKILSYNESDFIWYVKDLDGLVEDYIKRTERKKPYATEWDYDREEKRNSLWGTPSSPYYRLPTGLAEDLLSSLESISEKKREIDTERQAIQKEIRELRKTSPQSFIESIEATNVLSTHELKRHGELQDKALKWLYNRGYVAASEVTLPNGKRADAIGYNEQGHIVIVEAKASQADFLYDEKWESYLEYSDEFYFVLDKSIPLYIYRNKIEKRVGLLKENKNALVIQEPHTIEHTAKEREKVIFSIGKALSKKYVYGY